MLMGKEQEKTQRALAALDAMAETWAAKIGLRQAVRSILENPDSENRLVEFIKQAHVEGLYEGRTSPHQN